MLKFLIYVIFLFAFFGNYFAEKGLISPYVTLVTEAFVYLLFLFSLSRSKVTNYSWQLWFPFSFFLIVTFCSIIINNYFNLRPVFSLRLIFRFYFFYLALINLGLDDFMLKRINKLLFILFIIQLPASAYKFSIMGISERTIGTYATHGGGLTPIIPIVALGYLAGYFFFYRRRFYYILLSIGFILFGIAGGKRVLLFVYPITFIGIYILGYIIGKKENIIKHLGVVTCVAVLTIAASGLILKYHKGYRNNNEAGRTTDVKEAIEYAKQYTTKREGNRAGGRVAMTQLAFELTSKNGAILFGFGPGSLTGSHLDDRRWYDKRIRPIYESYGKTGLVFILIEYGLMGLIGITSILLIFIYRCWKWYKYEKEPYWKAFAMGSLVFAVYSAFIFFCYNRSSLLGDVITPVYYYAMAITHIKLSEIKQNDRAPI